ncbi:MAG: nucleoside-diphosphate kinase [Candidatus Verstraetearchaeota archaeon]|nr:nucleoside-diphosphate kinase [Candidatus Culexarchaeum yellowstonense]MCS7367141.1 nucleoside-diphosphate kinase [Candidatus Culexarchaeum yellowstonense]NHV11671.1 nucleoside-diphosphate kinase [Candidatus Verstraetearchaeota archaeon]
MSERTLILIKPDGVLRGLIGEVISRIENKGLKIIGLKMLKLSREKAEELYYMHRNKPFFENLISHITSGPVVAIVVEGNNAILRVRNMIGATSPQDALPGTIRGDYGLDTTRNVVHASDSVENSEREINLFFKEYELISYP